MADQTGLWTPRRALSLVEKTGVVLESGRGPVPNLVDSIAGAPVTGPWCDHPQGKLKPQADGTVKETLLPYPAWVTLQIKEAARAMSEQEARTRVGGVASLLPKTVDDT